MSTRRITRISAALGAPVLTLSLAACGDDAESSTSTATGAAADTDAQASEEAAFVTVTDPWVKSAKSGMTAAFGTLVNDGPEDVTLTDASADFTSAMELHETVQNDDGTMAMQPKDGGFTIPAGGTHLLEPGGDHLMVMDLTRPLKTGETVRFTLTFSDGSTTQLDATVKPFTGADEEYQNGEMDMGGDDMSDDMASPSESASGGM